MSGDCQRIQDGLLFFLDGEEKQEAARIEEHLERCPVCREKAESIRILAGWMTNLPRKLLPSEEFAAVRLTPLLTRLPEKTLPEGFDQKILRAVRDEKAREKAVIRGRKWQILQSMAAAAAIVVFSVLSFRSLDSQPSYPRVLNFSFSKSRSLYSPSMRKHSNRSAPSVSTQVPGVMRKRGSTPDAGSRKGRAK